MEPTKEKLILNLPAGKKYNQSYIRARVFEIGEFLNILQTTKEPYHTLDKGMKFKTSSLRYDTWLKSVDEKGSCICYNCGLQATHVVLEKDKKSKLPQFEKIYHLNLYGLDETGREMLFTKDHIKPKALGGLDHISNMQLYCAKCNTQKGHKY